MQVAEAGMIESPAMVRSTRPGRDARRRITLALRRAGEAGLSAPQVSAATGLSDGTTRHHLSTMVEAGAVEVTAGWPAIYRLSKAARIVTD